MKRPLFIIFGSIIILILLVVWFYVLFFSGSNGPEEKFSELSFGDTDTEIINQNPTPSEPVVDISTPKQLRQLTTKPTIGYQEVLLNASATPAVWYVESGTGHVYAIDLTNGEEKRVSGTTIPLAINAAITSNGQHAMFQSGTGNNREFIVGTFSTTSDSLETGLLNESIIDFTTTNTDTFLYAVQTTNSVIGKEYNPETNRTSTLFTIPFREATITWGSSASGPHFAYPKPSSKLDGFLYQIQDSKLTRLPVDGFGLSAVGSDSSVLYSKQVNGRYTTFSYNFFSNENNTIPITLIPEKCILIPNSDNYLCGGNTPSLFTHNTPDSWYQGVATYGDLLWEIDTVYPVGMLLFNISEEIGRELDTTKYLLNKTGERVYFINKTDGTLWQFNYIVEEVNTL